MYHSWIGNGHVSDSPGKRRADVRISRVYSKDRLVLHVAKATGFRFLDLSFKVLPGRQRTKSFPHLIREQLETKDVGCVYPTESIHVS